MENSYVEYQTIDWNEIKTPKILNLSILILIIISILLGHYFVSLSELFKLVTRLPPLLLLLPILIFIYIVLHELIHGILMRCYSDIKPEYSFSGAFIFAKSEAIFNKKAYLIIVLAPMLILGITSALLAFYLTGATMWFAIFIWIINLYASRGDVQTILALSNLQWDYWIKDDGDLMYIFKKI